MCTVINDKAYFFSGWLLYAIFKYLNTPRRYWNTRVSIWDLNSIQILVLTAIFGEVFKYCSWGICYNTANVRQNELREKLELQYYDGKFTFAFHFVSHLALCSVFSRCRLIWHLTWLNRTDLFWDEPFPDRYQIRCATFWLRTGCR